MNTGIDVGGSRTYALQYALMIYAHGVNPYGGGGGEAYVTLHDVEHPEEGPPRLGPGRAADLGFLRALTEGLQASVPPEILPEHVLCRTPDTIAWWSPSARRPLFFRERSELEGASGKTFPTPALVWAIIGQHLYVRALQASERPGADAPLFHAPFWNVNAAGRVCLGSMKRPGEISADSLRAWEDGFFGSLFTGPIGGPEPKGGLTKLWARLAGRPRFPTKQMVPANETLTDFVRGGGRA